MGISISLIDEGMMARAIMMMMMMSEELLSYLGTSVRMVFSLSLSLSPFLS